MCWKDEEKIDLHEIGLFVNTLNAKEMKSRHEGNDLLGDILKKAQVIIFELLGELEGVRMKSNLCISCEKPLNLGKFAYNQEMCWDCFKERVDFIVSNTPEGPDRDILNFLLNVTIHTFILR